MVMTLSAADTGVAGVAPKATKPAAGQERVLVPGQPEVEAYEERIAHGIPLHREVVASLRDLCAEFDVTCDL